MKNQQQLNTPDGSLKVFSIYYHHLQRHGFKLKGKTILHIGPGDLIGVDALFLLFGAYRVISIDLNPGNYGYPEPSSQLPFYETLWNHVVAQEALSFKTPWPEIILFSNSGVRYNTDRLLRLSPADVCNLPIKDACVDFAFSNAVLEHIKDPAAAIKEIARVLCPGGHTMHRVDLRDHRDFSKPLEFLKPGEPNTGCNLWRAFQFEEAFGKEPLNIIEFEVFDRIQVTEEDRACFDSRFANLPCADLEKLRFLIYALRV